MGLPSPLYLFYIFFWNCLCLNIQMFRVCKGSPLVSSNSKMLPVRALMFVHSMHILAGPRFPLGGSVTKLRMTGGPSKAELWARIEETRQAREQLKLDLVDTIKSQKKARNALTYDQLEKHFNTLLMEDDKLRKDLAYFIKEALAKRDNN